MAYERETRQKESKMLKLVLSEEVGGWRGEKEEGGNHLSNRLRRNWHKEAVSSDRHEHGCLLAMGVVCQIIYRVRIALLESLPLYPRTQVAGTSAIYLGTRPQQIAVLPRGVSSSHFTKRYTKNVLSIYKIS